MWDFKLSFLATDGKEVAAGEPVIVFDTTELRSRAPRPRRERDQAAKSLEKRSLEIEMSRRERRLQLAEAEANARKRRLGDGGARGAALAPRARTPPASTRAWPTRRSSSAAVR